MRVGSRKVHLQRRQDVGNVSSWTPPDQLHPHVRTPRTVACSFRSECVWVVGEGSVCSWITLKTVLHRFRFRSVESWCVCARVTHAHGIPRGRSSF